MLALFSSAELRQRGVIAQVSPLFIFNEHGLHQLGCQWGEGIQNTVLVQFFLLPKNVFGFGFPPPPIIG